MTRQDLDSISTEKTSNEQQLPSYREGEDDAYCIMIIIGE